MNLRTIAACLCILMALGSAGCAAEEPADQADLKTAAQWLEVVKAETDARKKWEEEHPEKTKFLLGAALAVAPMLGKDEGNVKRWEPKYREALQLFRVWWMQEGAAGYKAWREAGFPLGADDTFLIYHAQAMSTYHNACKNGRKPEAAPDIAAYGDRIVKRSNELMFAGLGDRTFGRAQLYELRLCSMLVSRIWYCTGDRLPYILGWTRGGYLAPGAPAPDFTLPVAGEIWASPAYADRDPFDELDIFRPAMVTRLLQVMNGYEVIPEAERKPKGPRARVRPWACPYEKTVTLSDHKGKKPVILVFMDPTDTWTWSGTGAPAWEPLYRTIKDKVEIYFVYSVVHDRAMPGKPGAVPFPGSRSYHPMSMEDRGWNTKKFYALYPTVTVPYLIDDSACRVQNAYGDSGGETCVYIVDTQGTVSFCLWNQPECHKFMWFDPPKEGLGGRITRVMSLVECNLKALLDEGGVWKAGMKPVIPDWRPSPTLDSLPVAAVDANAGTLTLTAKDGQAVTLSVDAHTRILQKNTRVALSAVAAGQTASVTWQSDPERPGEKMARLVILNDDLGSYWNPWHAPLWATARIEAVDPESATVTAKLVLPPPSEPNIGLEIWNDPSPAMKETMAQAGSNTWVRNQLRTWMQAPEQTFTMHIDRATDLFLNGMRANVSDLRVGDRLGIELVHGFKADDYWPRRLRAYRFQE
ncbi:MAG: hypothetical protein AMXMBFR7_34730 [Planctomycetota bacterium]